MQRYPLFKIYSKPTADSKKGHLQNTETSSAVGRSDMMPGPMPDPAVAAGSLPGLGLLAGLSATSLALADQLKYADLCSLGAMLNPLHLLGKRAKRGLPMKTERDEEDDRRKRRREKNKVAAARCRNKKKERTEYLQKESERLEMMNSDLKSQIEELKHERQQLILMLNRHRPTCIVRRDSVQTPDADGEAETGTETPNPLLEKLKAEEEEEEEEEEKEAKL